MLKSHLIFIFNLIFRHDFYREFLRVIMLARAVNNSEKLEKVEEGSKGVGIDIAFNNGGNVTAILCVRSLA